MTSVATVEKIVDGLKHKLTAARRELEVIGKERRPVAYAAEALDDRNAARRLSLWCARKRPRETRFAI